MFYVYVLRTGPKQYKFGRIKNMEKLKKELLNDVAVFWSMKTEHDGLLEIFLQKKFQEFGCMSGGLYEICPTILSKGLEEAELFLASYVEAEEEAGRYSKSDTNGSMKVASEEVKKLCGELNHLKRKLALLEMEKEFLENQIKSFIGDHAGVEGLATWKSSVAMKLDADIVKSNYPEVYEACLKENRSRRFYLSKEKEA